MSDPQPTDDLLEPESRPTSGPSWLHLLAAAAGALVFGTVASTGVMLFAGYRYTPEREFSVSVHLYPDADVRQRAAVETAMRRLPAEDGVRLESRQQAYEKLRARSTDPVQWEGVDAESMPESLHLTTVGRDFDCAPIPGIRKLDGVDRVRVVMRPEAGRPGAEWGC
ncbi:permease-like cell division protein FtsX [Actinoplanes sp. NEAU-A12]|uniref:Permease-like cell division protein FtsX n=1 Tax=Actinoplanes sandaracinus TaxID=3045177 RepID=A0ABT6WSV6_9ACTN|nr:permease-like cell division protein FtsX [Actinoplanes sandaracinus]MDI6102828.1 permease-like cell division protein FtsX [Actinoplanes sandaracinus]